MFKMRTEVPVLYDDRITTHDQTIRRSDDHTIRRVGTLGSLLRLRTDHEITGRHPQDSLFSSTED